MWGFLLAICIGASWAGVHYGLPTKWSVTLKTRLRVPSALLTSWRTWHNHHCVTRGETFCRTMDIRTTPPGPILDRLQGDLGRRAKAFVADRISRMPGFVAKTDFATVLFECCYNDPKYSMGYRLGESATHIITIEVGPIDDVLRIAVSNKRHCIAPPMLPMECPVKCSTRTDCLWPDHYHYWLTDSDMADTWITTDEVPFWEASEVPHRPDVTYPIFTAIRNAFVSLPVYYYTDSDKALAQTSQGLTLAIESNLEAELPVLQSLTQSQILTELNELRKRITDQDHHIVNLHAAVDTLRATLPEFEQASVQEIWSHVNAWASQLLQVETPLDVTDVNSFRELLLTRIITHVKHNILSQVSDTFSWNDQLAEVVDSRVQLALSAVPPSDILPQDILTKSKMVKLFQEFTGIVGQFESLTVDQLRNSVKAALSIPLLWDAVMDLQKVSSSSFVLSDHLPNILDAISKPNVISAMNISGLEDRVNIVTSTLLNKSRYVKYTQSGSSDNDVTLEPVLISGKLHHIQVTAQNDVDGSFFQFSRGEQQQLLELLEPGSQGFRELCSAALEQLHLGAGGANILLTRHLEELLNTVFGIDGDWAQIDTARFGQLFRERAGVLSLESQLKKVKHDAASKAHVSNQLHEHMRATVDKITSAQRDQYLMLRPVLSPVPSSSYLTFFLGLSQGVNNVMFDFQVDGHRVTSLTVATNVNVTRLRLSQAVKDNNARLNGPAFKAMLGRRLRLVQVGNDMFIRHHSAESAGGTVMTVRELLSSETALWWGNPFL